MKLALAVLVCCLISVQGQFQLGFGTPPPPSPGGFDPNCVDKLDNCYAFPKSNCQAPYDQWAKDYCPNSCGFCTGPTTPAPPCVDVLTNCAQYGQDSCTSADYKNWANKNCRRTCRLCTTIELTRLDAITTTIRPEDCYDKVDCRLYGSGTCSGQYGDWARDNCMNYCGFCIGTPTAPSLCADKIPNCAAYDLDTCTNDDYKLWAADNCKKFCGFCTGPVTIAYHPPTPPAPGKRQALKKRQFEANHHHHGTNYVSCWDDKTGLPVDRPECAHLVHASQEPQQAVTWSTESYKGDNFHPHPTIPSDWDKKPSTTEKPKITEKTTEDPTTVTTESVTTTFTEPSTTTTTEPPLTTTEPLMTTTTEPPMTSTTEPPITTTTEPPMTTTTEPAMMTTTEPPMTTTTEPPMTTTTEPPMTTTTEPPMTTTTELPTTTTAEPTTTTEQITTREEELTTTNEMPTTTLAQPASTKEVFVVKTPGSRPTTESTTQSTVTIPTAGSQGPISTSAAPIVPGSATPTAPPVVTDIASTSGVVTTSTEAPSTISMRVPPIRTTAPTTQEPNTPPMIPSTQAPTTAVPTTESSTPSTTTLPPTTTDSCYDKIDNCALYPKETACKTDVYKAWAHDKCPAYCQFCSPVTLTPIPCVDKLSNCKEFDSGNLCTAQSYFQWANENCYAYCGFGPCGNGSKRTTTPQPTTPTTTPEPTTTEVSNCTDVLDTCNSITDEKCVDPVYEPWAVSHCARRCGYCVDTRPCVDADGSCSLFPAEICTAKSYRGWARTHCRKFCNLCAAPTHTTATAGGKPPLTIAG